MIEDDAYVTLSGITYSPGSVHLGTAGTNYNATTYAYDDDGRQGKVVDPNGTITRTVFDPEGRQSSTWVGTNDTPTTGYWSPTNPAGMTMVSQNVYDNGGVGDGNLTQTTIFPGGSQAPRITRNYFDWQDRMVASKSGVILNEDGTEDLSAEDDGTNRPIEFSVFDNLGEVTEQDMYTGDGVAVTTTDGEVNAPDSDLLRAKSTSAYDDQGNVYQSSTYSVDPTDGDVGDAITTNTFRDLRGDVIATFTPGQPTEKSVFDGAGRDVMDYTTDGGAVNNDGSPLLDYADASSVTNDVVVAQTQSVPDNDGDTIETIESDRLPEDSTSAEGALGDASGTGGPAARVSYDASYYDDAIRETAAENVGTNGGAAWTRPSSPDSADADHLVTSMTYNSQGLEATSTDPRGIVNATFYNMLGETTETIAAYTDGTPTADTNQTTEYTYDGDGDETSQTAVMPSGTPSQTTAWVYGVTTSGGSTLDSNDLLAKVEYPNASTGDASTSASDDVSYTYDNLGDALTMTDQNQTTHSYGYDLLGRQTSDAVTTLGSGVDGTVRLHTTSFNSQGDVYQMTAYGSTLGGTVLNQVEDVYNGLGQLTGEYQANSGAVATSGPTPTPETQYAYSDPDAGSLQTEMIYPNGRILHYGRDNNALDTAIGRVDYLADAGGSAAGHLVDYLYMGVDTMVQQADANGVKLSYLQQSGDSSTITTGPQYAGDEVTGLDRFGQVIDQIWVNTATPTPTATDRFQYGYDQDGDVLYSDNLANSAESELYHSNSTTSGDDNSAYDPLARLTHFERGTLSASSHNGGVLDTVSSPSATQGFALDAVGNQTAVTTNGTTVDNTANSKNELTANGSADLTFDNNGNTLTDESGNTFTYDAWNHIATVRNSSGTTIATYAYNAAGQRIAETDASSTMTGFYYGGSGQILELRHGSTVSSQNVYNIDYTNDLLLRDDDSTSGNLGVSGSGLGERLFVQHDALCDVTALVNPSGVVLQRSTYGPYGLTTVLSSTWGIATDAYGFTFGFQGMWQDPVTGLYYTVNRDYDAATDIWLQSDPIGLASGSDGYQAFDSNPSDLPDPSGLMPPLDKMREIYKDLEQWLQVILWGIKIHQVIEQQYVTAHPGQEEDILTDSWLSTILKTWGGDPAKVNNPRERPDIVQNVSHPFCGYMLYEIKPNNAAGKAAALAEANYYRGQLAAGGLNNVFLGPSDEPGTSSAIPIETSDVEITWSSPMSGVILYTITPKDPINEAVKDLVAADSAAAAASLANSSGAGASSSDGVGSTVGLGLGAAAIGAAVPFLARQWAQIQAGLRAIWEAKAAEAQSYGDDIQQAYTAMQQNGPTIGDAIDGGGAALQELEPELEQLEEIAP